MNDNSIHRALVAGPGRREVRLIERPDPASHADPSLALVRQRLTMFYPGVEVEEIRRAEDEAIEIPLGRLAIGEVVRAAEGGGPSVGQLIYWSGPHAERAALDPAGDVWRPVESTDPTLMPAGVGAEAQFGLEEPIAATGGVPESVAVVGAGLLGHLAAQWLKSRGSRVTVVENSPKRLEFCKYLGLPERVDTHNLRWLERVDRWNPNGVEAIVDANGFARSLEGMIERLRPGGWLCRLGVWRSAPSESVARTIRERGIRCFGPRPTFGDAAEHARALGEWLDAIGSGRIATERLITHRVRPEEAPLAAKRFAAGIRSWLGAVVDWAQ